MHKLCVFVVRICHKAGYFMTRLIFSLLSSVTYVRFFYIHYIDIYTPLNTVCKHYPVSREMFKTMRCFRTHAQWKRMSGGGKAVRIVRIYLP